MFCDNNRDKVAVAVIATVGYFFHGILNGLDPVFFPRVAEERGASSLQYSMVYTLFSLSSLLALLPASYLGKKVGLKLLYLSGEVTSVCYLILFAFVSYIKPVDTFIIACYALKFVSGFAAIFGSTALFSYLVTTFPDHVGTATAGSEVLMGLGATIGPVIGSLLFECGGFFLPYSTMAGVVGLNTLVALVFLPNLTKSEDEEKGEKYPREKERETISILQSFKHPTVFLPFLDVVLAMSFMTMNTINRERHLSTVDATKDEIRLVFSTVALAYMPTQLILGPLSDRMTLPTILPVVGYPFIIGSIAILGPSRLIPSELLPRSVHSIWVSSVVLFMSVSASVIPAYKRSVDAAKRLGFNMGKESRTSLSALLIGSIEIGDMLGSTLAGLGTSLLGFVDMTLIFLAMAMAGFIMAVIYLWNDVCQVRTARKLALGPVEENTSQMEMKV